MKVQRMRLWSYLVFASMAIVLCAELFASALRAQSAPGGTPTVLDAVPDGSVRSGSAIARASSGEHWLNHRAIVDPSPDMKCAIVEWIAASPKPSLVVVCPPDEMFAPVRLYFKLSWKRDTDVPGNFQIIAEPKTMIKMHWSSQGDYQVLLPTERQKGRHRIRSGSTSTTSSEYLSSPNRVRPRARLRR